ncbi:phage major capsid protein [Listeria monocytogenes]|nr:phage major capsid protein [Listeria monocytogenes]EDN9846508.1 phage major capsid protein [Listeria monocytogenes]
MDNLKDQIASKQDERKQALTTASEHAQNGDLEKAKEAKANADAIKEDIKKLQSDLAELEELANLAEPEAEATEDEPEAAEPPENAKEAEPEQPEEAQAQAQDPSEEDPEDEEKKKTIQKETRSMDKINIDLENKKTKEFEAFIRTKGKEVRSLTTTNTGAIVPEDITQDVLELKQGELDLSKYITVEPVGTGKGKFPVAKRISSILATKEEAKEIAELDEELFTEIDFNVATRIGKIVLSTELVEDSGIDVVAYAKKQMAKMVLNTNNAKIVEVLNTFAKVNGVADIDTIKQVFNVELDPALNKSVVVNQDAYNYLDTLKDGENRPLLQPNPTQETAKTLFGSPVIVVSNKLAPTPAKSIGFVFVGDLEEAVALFLRREITAEWTIFDSYSEGLSVGVRSDYKQVDADAGRLVVMAVPAQG